MTPNDALAGNPIGSFVGPYRLESRLGAGGMGEVFRATDTRLRRTVAIKFLLGDKSGETQRRRFLQEARAASALNHSHIVVVYDISSCDGRDFLVMEYIEGGSLEDLIPEDGLAPGKAAHLGAQIASALAAAHEADIVHRDIKPANVMVTPAQLAKVLDFGIAQIAHRAVFFGDGDTQTLGPETMAGAAVGTVSFMSPEQARGEPVDGYSDVFSLGCTLYKAATGRLPFRGEGKLATMHLIATAPPVPPRSLRPDLPPELDRLILACLEKSPRRRPSAAELENDLRGISSPRRTPAFVEIEGRRSVAVIPFRFRTAASDDRFLSVALAEAVANRLSSTGKLLVRPVSTLLRFAQADLDWSEAARELNVDLIVEGAIQRMGSKIRVQIQAIQASDLRAVHSAQQDGDIGDLFALQDRLADSVSRFFMPGAKTSLAPAVPPTQNPLAYELYLRATERVAHMNKFDTGSAIEMLTRAVELDPDFADAWGLLAQACSRMGMHLDPSPLWFERAEKAVARTLELDPVQCDALCSRAQIVWSPSRGFQNRPALRAINAALRINPGNSLSRQLRGAILAHLGEYEQSRRDSEEALLANPKFALGFAGLGLSYVFQLDFEEAERAYIRALELEPSLVHANIFFPVSAIYRGRLDQARERVRRARLMVPEEPQLNAIDGLIAAYEGDFAAAERLADSACSGDLPSVTHTHHSWHCAAGAYALIGRKDKAIAQLRRCADMGLANYRLFGSDPALRGLTNHPEFQALQTQIRRLHDELRPELEAAVRTPTE